MTDDAYDELVTLRPGSPPWERVFTVAPLVLVGTREEDGAYDLAPKHMVTPVGLGSHFAFVCTPRHATYHNAAREGVFTVTYLRARQVVFASLTAAPRCEDDSKPIVDALPTFPATEVDGVFVREGYLFLECELDRVVDGFDDHSILVGTVVASHADAAFLRAVDRDDNDLVREAPLFAYLHPGRFTRIQASNAFPMPADFHD